MDVGTLAHRLIHEVRESGQNYEGSTRALSIALNAITQKRLKMDQRERARKEAHDLGEQLETMP